MSVSERCGAWGGCTLPAGHNMGHVDIPENHKRSAVPERWEEMGADALYGLLGWPERKPDWHSGDAEHVQAHAVLTPVLGSLTRQVEELMSYEVRGIPFELVSRAAVLKLING